MKREQQERAKSHDFKFFFNSWISIDDKKKPCKSIVKTREERGGVAAPRVKLHSPFSFRTLEAVKTEFGAREQYARLLRPCMCANTQVRVFFPTLFVCNQDSIPLG